MEEDAPAGLDANTSTAARAGQHPLNPTNLILEIEAAKTEVAVA